MHNKANKNVKKLRKHPGGIVVQANPQIHGFPWEIADKKSNRAILKELKQQPRMRLRQNASPRLKEIILKWTTRGAAAEYQKGHQIQGPRHLWANRNMVTDFQVWVTFRMATQQLNLHYRGVKNQVRCPMDLTCNVSKVTMTHISWYCKRARQFWRRCLEHWLGGEVSDTRLEMYKSYFAGRNAPVIGSRLQQRFVDWYGQWRPENAEMLHWMLCSMGYALLWQIRNQVVHDGQMWRAPQQLEYMWNVSIRQLQAIARQERYSMKTQIAGLQFQLSLDCFVDMKAEAEPPDPLPTPAKWLRTTEAKLTKRLQQYQAAINKG